MWFFRRLGGLLRDTMLSLRGHDLALHAAGVTFYAGIAVVPSILLAIWLSARLVGDDRMVELGRSLGDALPDELGAPQVAEATIAAGLGQPTVVALAVLIPATFYGEGLRRAFVSLTDARDTLIGWRGRLLVLPLFAAAPALLLVVLLVTPTVARLFGEGGASVLLGIVLAFLTDWVVLWFSLTWVYRVVSPRRPGWLASVWGGAVTGSFIAGFVQGFVLFLSLPLDLGLPFGGFVQIGGVVAVGLWLYLLHVLVLVGFAMTLRMEARGGVPWHPVPEPAPAGDGGARRAVVVPEG
ncbi:MAG: Putative glycosyl transferase [uncultured Corynebacteriales bacterium]|uniref:Glycosyl transferase n=1 Tax=uncultured Mycobacteriales bacterium TaxID=581187 RepID=A0A6J4JIZ1_9ACTN|nr:MAG: Putative glycosyl transferase [uncultured Corynebacteriales bacterium]